MSLVQPLRTRTQILRVISLLELMMGLVHENLEATDAEFHRFALTRVGRTSGPGQASIQTLTCMSLLRRQTCQWHPVAMRPLLPDQQIHYPGYPHGLVPNIK